MGGKRATRKRQLSLENRLIAITAIAHLLSSEGVDTMLDSQWLHLSQNWMLALDVPFKESWDALIEDLRRAA